MGPGLRARLRARPALAAALRDALSLRPVPDPGRALRRRASPCPTSPTATPTPSATGICRPVTFVPYDGMLHWRSGEDLVESSFADALTAREAARRYRTAICVELPDGLPRILAAAHERLRRCAPAGTATPAGSSSPPTASTRARWRGCCARRPASRRPSSCTPRHARRTSSRRSRARPTPGSSRSTWSARASTSRACASASTRRRPRRRSSFARSSGASCARSPGAACR